MNISVIMCSKNRSNKIEWGLRSFNAKEMNKAKAELILINNGSTDNTKGIMNSFKKKSNFPVQVIDEPKKGKSRGINKGLKRAKGKIIVFTNDDIYFKKGYFQKLLRYFEKDIGFIGGKVMPHKKGESNISCMMEKKKFDYLPFKFIRSGMICGANMAFKKEVLNKIGNFDLTLGAGTPFAIDDLDMATRAVMSGFKGKYAPNLVVYHKHKRIWGSKETMKDMKDFNRGRGAHYFKFILSGKINFIYEWYKCYKTCIKIRGFNFATSRLLTEIEGGIKWLIFWRLIKNE